MGPTRALGLTQWRHEDRQPHRRAHRRGRQCSWCGHGAGRLARCRPVRDASRPPVQRDRPRQPGGAADTMGRPERRRAPPGRGSGMEQVRVRPCRRRVGRGPDAAPHGRRPLPRHWIDQRDCAALPLRQEEAEGRLAGCAHGRQQRNHQPIGKCAWHAGLLPAGLRAGAIDWLERPAGSPHAGRHRLHRHPQRGQRGKAGNPPARSAGFRYAPYRRARHAQHDDRSAARRGR